MKKCDCFDIIVLILLLSFVVLLMSSVQAKELTEVKASDILKQIENGEDVYRENVRITGNLDLDEIELETVTIIRSVEEIGDSASKQELKVVESKIKIKKSVIEDDMDFSTTQFREKIDFSETLFSGKSRFTYSYFRSDVNFLNADFIEEVHFSYAIFNDDAQFSHADFRDNAHFWDTDFRSDAQFIDADFRSRVHFDLADFLGKATFNLAEFNKVSFKGTTFTSVCLNGSKFNQMEVEWIDIKDVLVFDDSTYTKSIKNFGDEGKSDDADAATYHYRQLSQANKKWSQSKIGDVLALVFCGYGVKPINPLILSAVIITGFAVGYCMANRRVSLLRAFYLSLVTFIPMVSNGYLKDCYPKLRVIESFIGWIILTFFILTLANVWIRP